MNKNKIITAIVILVLVLLGFVFFFGKKNNDSTGMQSTKSTTQLAPKPTSEKITGKMFDLLKLNKNLKCAIKSQPDEKMTYTGTVYISGSKIKSDSDVSIEGGIKLTSHMLSDGEWVYTWTSQSNQGIKMKMTALTELAAKQTPPETTKPTSATDLNSKNYDFDCDTWKVEASSFAIPTEISFVDYSETMQNLVNPSPNAAVTPNMCSACAFIDDSDQKAACLKTYNCK